MVYGAKTAGLFSVLQGLPRAASAISPPVVIGVGDTVILVVLAASILFLGHKTQDVKLSIDFLMYYGIDVDVFRSRISFDRVYNFTAS